MLKSVACFLMILFLQGCETKVEDMSKEECKKAGHIYTEKKVFNYLLGKEEIRGECIQRK